MKPGRLFLLVTLSGLLLAFCGTVACRPDPIVAPAPAFQELDVHNDGLKLHTRLAGNPGSGEVLIAIHGGPGMSSQYMLNLEELAGPDLAVVTYDQRGTGHSDRPEATTAAYELADYVTDLEAVRQASGADTVHLLGHSWGGLVAMSYAAAYPERVESLLLAGSGPPTRAAIDPGFASLGRRIRTLQRDGAIPKTLPTDAAEQLEAILPAYFSDPTFTFPIGQRETPEYSEEANRLTWAALGDYDLRPELAGLRQPVLILWGEDDPFGLPMAQATEEALIGAPVTFTMLAACGHFWHECPEPFFDQVRAFLQSS